LLFADKKLTISHHKFVYLKPTATKTYVHGLRLDLGISNGSEKMQCIYEIDKTLGQAKAPVLIIVHT